MQGPLPCGLDGLLGELGVPEESFPLAPGHLHQYMAQVMNMLSDAGHAVTHPVIQKRSIRQPKSDNKGQ